MFIAISAKRGTTTKDETVHTLHVEVCAFCIAATHSRRVYIRNDEYKKKQHRA